VLEQGKQSSVLDLNAISLAAKRAKQQSAFGNVHDTSNLDYSFAWLMTVRPELDFDPSAFTLDSAVPAGDDDQRTETVTDVIAACVKSLAQGKDEDRPLAAAVLRSLMLRAVMVLIQDKNSARALTRAGLASSFTALACQQLSCPFTGFINSDWDRKARIIGYHCPFHVYLTHTRSVGNIQSESKRQELLEYNSALLIRSAVAKDLLFSASDARSEGMH